MSERYYEDVPPDPMKRTEKMPWPEHMLRFKTAQLGGNARHSGFNPGEGGTPPLTAAWVAQLGSGATTPAVIQGGRAFAISGAHLHAVEMANGAEIWSYNFGAVYGGISWPSAGDRALYVATSNNSGDTWFRQIDRASGLATFKLPFGSQWEHYWSPLIVGSAAYIDGGSYGGLYGFNYGIDTIQNVSARVWANLG